MAERGLFKERIRSLDKKIHPGLSKLTWASKGISEFFVGECRMHSKKVQAIVDDYKRANMSIAQSCRKISELLLVNLDGKKIYQVCTFYLLYVLYRPGKSLQLKNMVHLCNQN